MAAKKIRILKTDLAPPHTGYSLATDALTTWPSFHTWEPQRLPWEPSVLTGLLTRSRSALKHLADMATDETSEPTNSSHRLHSAVTSVSLGPPGGVPLSILPQAL